MIHVSGLLCGLSILALIAVAIFYWGRASRWQFSLRTLLTVIFAASVFFAAVSYAGGLGFVAYAILLSVILTAVGVWRHKRRLIIGGAMTLCIATLAFCFGLRHDHSRPSQSRGEFQAIRQIDRWSVFGHELYAHNVLGVIPSHTYPPIEQWENRREETRLFGHTVSQNGEQFHLGEFLPNGMSAYSREDADGCMNFIIRTKYASANPKERVWALDNVWGISDRGKDLLQAALKDPDPQVRAAAQKWLDRN